MAICERFTHLMASKTKYQPAPQRDSLEEQRYAQAPPSYQAEAVNDAALFSGAPRGEDDNVPDDFKVIALQQFSLAPPAR